MTDKPEFTNRGFMHMPYIPSTYGGTINVYESSNASGPHLWVKIECPVDLNDPYGAVQESVAHLTLNDAKRLAEHLNVLIDNHYQKDL